MKLDKLLKSHPLAISACLAGKNCRYDGTNKSHQAVLNLISTDTVLICPEELGGLGTPRPPAGLVGGDGNDVWDGKARVINQNGEDVTQAFCQGALLALENARKMGCRMAVLKARSPSCGKGVAGGIDHPVVGDGVTTALFRRAGIEVFTEEELA